MSGHMRLEEDETLLRINTASNILSKEFQASLSQQLGILSHRHRMHVYHAEIALIFILELNPILHSTDIVTNL
jgi:hypothetical protein